MVDALETLTADHWDSQLGSMMMILMTFQMVHELV